MAGSTGRREGGRSHDARRYCKAFTSRTMNLLHNEGCDYGTFARAERPAKQFHKLASLSVSFHTFSMSLCEAFHVMPSAPPVHMLTVLVRQRIAPP
jgi:hypothetical protein